MDRRKITVSLLSALFVVLFLVPCASFSKEGEGTRGNVKRTFLLNADIMNIDLEKNSIIVSEKVIRLLVKDNNGMKEWETVFRTGSGALLDPKDLKEGDDVVVRGVEEKDGTLVAIEIMLKSELSGAAKEEASAKAVRENEQKAEKNKKPKRESKMRKVDGVWVN